MKHFFARYPGWGIDRVTDGLISLSEVIAFDDTSWNVAEIQARYRAVIDAVAPESGAASQAVNGHGQDAPGALIDHTPDDASAG